MRPEDILMPTPAGLCCKPGGFHIDPVRPVERAVITHGHSDHARAGHGAVLATQETLDMMRLRYGENFAAQHAGDRLWRGAPARRRQRQVPSRRPCARLGADRGVLRRTPASSPPATTRTRPTRPARRSSWCRATSSSPRRRSGCRCSATATPAARSRSCWRRSRCFRSARIWSAPIRSARRSA